MFEYTEDEKYVITQKVIKDGVVVEIHEYFENTPKEEISTNLKNKHFIKNGLITKTEEYDQKSQELIKIYQYEKNAKYEEREEKRQYMFKIENNFVVTAYRYVVGSEQVVSSYEYVPKTRFGKHRDAIKLRRDYKGKFLDKVTYYEVAYPDITRIINYYHTKDQKNLKTKDIIDFLKEDIIKSVRIYEKESQDLKFIYYMYGSAKLSNYMKHVKQQFVFKNNAFIRRYVYGKNLKLNEVIDYIPNSIFDYETGKYQLKDKFVAEAELKKRHYYLDAESFIDYAIEYEGDMEYQLKFREYSKVETNSKPIEKTSVTKKKSSTESVDEEKTSKQKKKESKQEAKKVRKRGRRK